MRISVVLLLELFCLVAQSQSTHLTKVHNRIDSIHSAAEIKDLLVQIDSFDYRDIVISSYAKFRPLAQHLVDSLYIPLWGKADFDNNGYTDLLVIGAVNTRHATLCIMDSGDHYSVKRIARWWFDDNEFAILSQSDSMPAVLYYSLSAYSKSKLKTSFRIDTLIFREGDFVEYNRSRSAQQIDSIIFSTEYCFGTCPVFSMSIRADRSTTFDAIDFNQGKGIYTTRIDTAHFNKLISLLHYIDFEKLDSSYSMPVTDMTRCKLTIYYNHGQVKSISDYGLEGTFGLSALYDILYNLRDNQMWDKPYPGDMIKNETHPVLQSK